MEETTEKIELFDNIDTSDDITKGLLSFYEDTDPSIVRKNTATEDLSDEDKKKLEEDKKNDFTQDYTNQRQDQSSSDTTDTNDLESKFKSLVEIGYLNLPEDYKAPTTDEEFEKAIQDSKTYTKDSIVNEIFSSLPDEGKPLLEYLLNGGKDLKSFKEVFNPDLDLEKIDIEDVENQKKTLELFYKRKGFSDIKAKKQVEVAENLLELESEAKEAHQEMLIEDKESKKKFLEDTKAQKKAQEEVEQKRWSALNETLKVTEDFGGGYVIGPKAKPKAIESLYRQVKLQDGSVTTDFNYRLRHVVLQDPKLTLVLSDILNKLEKDPKTQELYFNFENIKSSAETKVTQSLKDKLDTLTKNDPKFKGGQSSDPTKKGFNWDAVL